MERRKQACFNSTLTQNPHDDSFSFSLWHDHNALSLFYQAMRLNVSFQGCCSCFKGYWFGKYLTICPFCRKGLTGNPLVGRRFFYSGWAGNTCGWKLILPLRRTCESTNWAWCGREHNALSRIYKIKGLRCIVGVMLWNDVVEFINMPNSLCISFSS